MPLPEIPIGFRFEITFDFGRKLYSFPVIKTWETDQIEHFMLMASNKVLLFQSNRPMLRAKGLKNKRIDWKMIFGDTKNASMIDEVINQINYFIKCYEGHDPNYVHPKNS